VIKAEHGRLIPRKLTVSLWPSNSQRHGEEIPANPAFQKRLKRADAREELKKLVVQEKRLKN